jgi:3-hydroxypropanoate dehydrogenase
MRGIDEAAWKVLLTEARTQYSWTDRPVDDVLLRRLYELLRLAPTALNSQPLRLVFVKSAEAKARLRPALDEGNVEKAMKAPVTAIVAFDSQFHEKLGDLVPHWPGAVQAIGAMPVEARERMALLSATLQAGYLITTARGLGLDCGPMGGFKPAQLDAEFFPDGRWRSFLLINLGHGDGTRVFPRAPRIDFGEACRIA